MTAYDALARYLPAERTERGSDYARSSSSRCFASAEWTVRRAREEGGGPIIDASSEMWTARPLPRDTVTSVALSRSARHQLAAIDEYIAKYEYLRKRRGKREMRSRLSVADEETTNNKVDDRHTRIDRAAISIAPSLLTIEFDVNWR